MADATTDRAPVRMLFITDEEWQALTAMIDRGIDNALECAEEVRSHPEESGIEDPVDYVAGLRVQVSEAQRAIETIGRREVARG